MKAIISKGMFAVAIALLALTGSLRAQDQDGCTNSTLMGDYAFTVSGKLFLPNGTVVEREGVAMTHFDGSGNLSQVDFVLSSPNGAPPPGPAPVDPVTGFHNQETGIYTVNADCTGHFEIDNPSITTPTGQVVKGAVIHVHFVLSHHGRSIHTIVTSLTPPGAPGPVPALIRSEGRKLGRITEDAY